MTQITDKTLLLFAREGAARAWEDMGDLKRAEWARGETFDGSISVGAGLHTARVMIEQGWRPDPETLCPGDCEGMGVVPVKADDDDQYYRDAWKQAEAADPSDDGWHFVQCPTCGGTGTKPVLEQNP
jgi:hypothetical protein